MLSPIWKLKAPPIKLIIKINNPPKTELAISFKIAFRGTENIFPKIHKPIIQIKIVITVEKSKFYHHTFLIILMIKLGQI